LLDMSFDPILLFFILGLLSGVVRSPLRLPPQAYELVSIILLLAIGLKGGVELSSTAFMSLLPQILVVAAMGLALPLLAFPVLKFAGRFPRADAASIAAHYGSVSVGTYAVAAAYLANLGVTFEAHMPLLLVILEVPAIIVGVWLAKGAAANGQWRSLAHEIFSGKGIVLLLGGLAIGWAAGKEGVATIEPLFFDAFKGVLALFLLEMGVITASKLGDLKKYGFFLVIFAIGMPLVSAIIGGWLGLCLSLSIGGTAMLATLAASASYIAVPAAMRISVPEANPSLSLTASLGLTFPFNVLVGIPLYLEIARWLHA
jgi:hypothetical protein